MSINRSVSKSNVGFPNMTFDISSVPNASNIRFESTFPLSSNASPKPRPVFEASKALPIMPSYQLSFMPFRDKSLVNSGLSKFLDVEVKI